MGINVQIKTRSELDVCSYAARGGTLIVINSGTLIQDINFFCANEKY